MGSGIMRDKRKKFVELIEARVNRAIKDLKLIGNLSNKNSYYYEDKDVRKIFRVLQKELDLAKGRFTDGGKSGANDFKLED